MCRNMLNIGWRGEVYDCDFNQSGICSGKIIPAMRTSTREVETCIATKPLFRVHSRLQLGLCGALVSHEQGSGERKA
jgi:hypothetical protein